MTPLAPGGPDEWGREIRGWRLGKLGKNPLTGESPAVEAARAALREQLPGPLLVWGDVEGGGDRTKEFDAGALRAAAMEREEGEDLWLFTSEGEIGEALGGCGPGRRHGLNRPKRSILWRIRPSQLDSGAE